MGEPAGKLRQQTHIEEGLVHPFLPFLLADPLLNVHQAFADDVIHLGPLIQRSLRVLKDHLDFPHDLPVQLSGDSAVDLLAFIDDIPAGRRDNSHDCPADGRFTGTGFSHQSEGLSLVDLEIDLLDRLILLLPITEREVQIL